MDGDFSIRSSRIKAVQPYRVNDADSHRMVPSARTFHRPNVDLERSDRKTDASLPFDEANVVEYVRTGYCWGTWGNDPGWPKYVLSYHEWVEPLIATLNGCCPNLIVVGQ